MRPAARPDSSVRPAWGAAVSDVAQKSLQQTVVRMVACCSLHEKVQIQNKYKFHKTQNKRQQKIHQMFTIIKLQAGKREPSIGVGQSGK